MSIRYRRSDFSGAGGCRSCPTVETDVITGALRVKTTFAPVPGKGGRWPDIGCVYRSPAVDWLLPSTPFGAGREIAGLMGLSVQGNAEQSVHVIDELGWRSYYVYDAGEYISASQVNKLYSISDGGWLEERDNGLYFEFNAAGKLTKARDVGSTLYFAYDGNGPQYVRSEETNETVYFESSGDLITKIKDVAGRETLLSYDDDDELYKIISPTLCETYFEYNNNEEITAATDRPCPPTGGSRRRSRKDRTKAPKTDTRGGPNE